MTCDSRTPVAQSDFVIAPKGSALSVPGHVGGAKRVIFGAPGAPPGACAMPCGELQGAAARGAPPPSLVQLEGPGSQIIGPLDAGI